MAGLENMRKKLGFLFDASQGFRGDMPFDPCASYGVSAGGTLNLLSQSHGEYNINERGLQKRTSGRVDEDDMVEKTYQCASHEMCIFGTIGRGASSVVCKAIHIPSHRILALKKINIFDKNIDFQLLRVILINIWLIGMIEVSAGSSTRIGLDVLSILFFACLASVFTFMAYVGHDFTTRQSIFLEQEKRQQLLNEIRTLCEAPHANELVEFHGAFYTPASGRISIALEYMDGGSLADLVRVKGKIPEPVLSVITRKLLQGLNFLHGVRHLVHRDIKPANLLINLKGEPKITDFGTSAGLENSIAMCATFVGTVPYMSPERVNNECYSYPADIWSLGLSIFECGTGEFPFSASKGQLNLMLQVISEPSPSPSREHYSAEFCSFVDACLQKDPQMRLTAEQLLSHPFITKYENAGVDLPKFVQSIFDPVERLKELANMLTVHYYMLFDGPDELWHHMKTLYCENSAFSYGNQIFVGESDIFSTLSKIRNMLMGDIPDERLVHVVENLQCCAYGQHGIAIRVAGSFVRGSNFIPSGDGVEVQGISEDPPADIESRRMGTFNEKFIMEPGKLIGCSYVCKQELYIQQL